MKHKLVIIEDNTEVRENICEILELDGYEVHSAANGLEGVKTIREVKPDLILCDIMMPQLDGYGVLHMLQKDANTRFIPFIFLTAKAEKEDFRTGMNLGADDYITKPFEEHELLSTIEMRLEKRSTLSPEASEDQFESLLSGTKAIATLEHLQQSCEVRTLGPGESLYRESDSARAAFYLKSGKLKLFKHTEYGKTLIHNLAAAGDFVGITALLTNSPYQESAQVLEESTVSVIPADDFFKLLHNDKDVSAYFIKLLAKGLEDAEEKLIHQAYDSVRQRVAAGLLQLRQKYGQDNKDFSVKMLREDLAALVGTSKETVIRTLSDFKQEGIIQIDKEGTLTILDAKTLEQLTG